MIVERDLQIAELQQRILLADSGRGQIILMSGEAGIGKTSLLHSLFASAGPTEFWAWGGCDPLTTPRPLGPLFDMAPTLDPSITALLQSASERSTLYSQIVSVLENRPGTTVLVFEDIHWADHATLDLLRFLSRRITFLRVVIIITMRNEGLSEEHHARTVLGELPATSTFRLNIAPLTEAGVATLAKAAHVSTDGLYEATNGNPFFVTELIEARRTLGPDLPHSIRDAVSARLSRLPAETRNLLELISIIPNSVFPAQILGLMGANSQDAIDAATQPGILHEDSLGALRFKHELVRRAILERLSATQRRDLHQRVYAHLTQDASQASIDQIVHHAEGALNGNGVLTYAPKAASNASHKGAHHEAAAHYATALKFVDDAEPEQAASLYESWAYEATLAARIDDMVLDARRTAVTLWKMLKRPEKVSENLRGLSRLHWYRGESIEANKFADQAIAISESTPPSAEHAMAYSLRSQLLMLNDQMDEAVEYGKKALALEASFPDADVRIHALNNVGSALAFRGNENGVAMLQESLETAVNGNHQEHAARAYNNMAEYAVEFRKFELAEQTLSAGLAYDTERDLDSWTYYLSGRLALLRLDQGRLHDAERIAHGVVNQERLTLLMKLPAAIVLSRARLRLGNNGALTMLQDALGDALATDELQHIVPARLSLLEAAWLLDQDDLAREQFDALKHLAETDRHPWNIGELAVWSRRLNQSTKFEHSENLPEPHQLELNGSFKAAGDAWAALGLPYAAALAYAQEISVPALSSALQIVDEMRAGLATAKIRKIARQNEIETKLPKGKRGPYKGARDHPMGLTQKEQTVLNLLMKGLTNREIADSMSRSQRTIEHHVSAILKKLNASSRMAVILRVQNEPWLTDQE